MTGEMKWAEAEAILREAVQVVPVFLVPNNLAFCRFSQDDPEGAFEIRQPNLAPERDMGTPSSLLKLAVDVDSEWGLQFAKNIRARAAVSNMVNAAALNTLVENGVYEAGQHCGVEGGTGRWFALGEPR
jgi:hypothetical protein